MPVARRTGSRFQNQAGGRVRRKRTRAGFGCLWGGGAARKISARARAALVGSGTNEQRYAAGRLLLFVPCPWRGVPPASSETKPDAAWEASACALALAASGECAVFKLVGRARLAALVMVGALPWRGVPAAAYNTKLVAA